MAKRVPNETLVEVTDRVPKLFSCYVGQQGTVFCYTEHWYWVRLPNEKVVLNLRRREFKLVEITSSK